MLKKRFTVVILISFSLFFFCLEHTLLAKIRCNAGGNRVKITWDKPAQKRGNKIVGYRVYRKWKDEDTYRLLTPGELLKDPEYVDDTVKTGDTYIYVITSVDQRGLESPLSNGIDALPILPAPVGLKATAGKMLIELTWERYTHSTIRGYHLYRATAPEGPYSLIASQPDSIISYRDTDIIPERNYYYALTAEDLYGVQSPYSEKSAATALSISTGELNALEDVKGLNAKAKNGKICVDWEESTNEFISGYNVYRRIEGMDLEWTLLTVDGLVRIPPFEDFDVRPGNVYVYTVAGVDDFGNEGRFPRQVRVFYQDIFITKVSLSPNDKPLKAGDKVFITAVGTAGIEAYFEVEGIFSRMPMEETATENEGVYYGTFHVPAGIDKEGIHVTCFFEDPNNKSVSMRCPELLNIDNTPPPAPANLNGSIDNEGRVVISWHWGGYGPTDAVSFKVYRTDKGELAAKIPQTQYIYTDHTALPGQRYIYYVTTLDLAGNESDPSLSLEIELPPDTIPPAITAFRLISDLGENLGEDKGLWYVGERVSVILTGEPGCLASFSIGGAIRDINMQESREREGEYIGSYVFKAGDEAEGIVVAGKLEDISKNSTQFVLPMKVSVLPASEGPSPKIYSIEYSNPPVSLEKKMVADDLVKVTVRGTPGCEGMFGIGVGMDDYRGLYLDWSGFRESEWPGVSGYAIYVVQLPASRLRDMDNIARAGLGQRIYFLESGMIKDLVDGKIWVAILDADGNPRVISTPKWGFQLKQTNQPGIYEGIYRIKPGDQMNNGYIYAMLKDAYGRISAPNHSKDIVNIDTSTRIAITADPPVIKADKDSESRIVIRLKDINGDMVRNREVEVGLFTTPEYTGLAGLGTISGLFANQGTNNLYGFITDDSGVIEFVYKSGSSAKTAIFKIMDKITGDVGTAYITSFLETQLGIELYDSKSRQKTPAKGYLLALDADPEWLTADGTSRSRIIAKLTDQSGRPIAGHRILFSINSGDGYLLRNLADTDENGNAEVAYSAGTRIGTVEIIARDTSVNTDECTCTGIPFDIDNHTCITYIILKSDAPSIIEAKAEPGSLPADCHSTANVFFKITDVNGNPCKAVGLDISISQGGGNILRQDYITDFLGKGEAVYQAGCEPGVAFLNLKVTSRIPNEKELKEIIWDEGFPWE